MAGRIVRGVTPMVEAGCSNRASGSSESDTDPFGDSPPVEQGLPQGTDLPVDVRAAGQCDLAGDFVRPAAGWSSSALSGVQDPHFR